MQRGEDSRAAFDGQQCLQRDGGGVGVRLGVGAASGRDPVVEPESTGRALLGEQEPDRGGGDAAVGAGQGEHGQRLTESVGAVPCRVGGAVGEPAGLRPGAAHEGAEGGVEVDPADGGGPAGRQRDEQDLGGRAGDADGDAAAGVGGEVGGVGHELIGGRDRGRVGRAAGGGEGEHGVRGHAPVGGAGHRAGKGPAVGGDLAGEPVEGRCGLGGGAGRRRCRCAAADRAEETQHEAGPDQHGGRGARSSPAGRGVGHGRPPGRWPWRSATRRSTRAPASAVLDGFLEADPPGGVIRLVELPPAPPGTFDLRLRDSAGIGPAFLPRGGIGWLSAHLSTSLSDLQAPVVACCHSPSSGNGPGSPRGSWIGVHPVRCP